MTTWTLGVSREVTSDGKLLKDGGAALARDGVVVAAIAEERLSRVKYAGGFELASAYLLSSFGLTYRDIDLVVVSTCCEVEHSIGSFDHLGREVRTCNHHLSHAYASYFTSKMERAIIMVMDGGGNITGGSDSDLWWARPRDQQTYYLVDQGNFSVIGSDFSEPCDVGLGELFRAFTFFLGWDSSRDAGKLMSLAASGNADRFPVGGLVDIDSEGRMYSRVRNDPEDPISIATSALERAAIFDINPRVQGTPFSQDHIDLAAWVQRELEQAIVKKAEHLVTLHGVREICLSGGVAYNCRAVGRLAESSLVNSVHVGPGAGDVGQCLGNVLFGIHRVHGILPSRVNSAFLGPSKTVSFRDMCQAAAIASPELIVTEFPTSLCARRVAELICEGGVGATYLLRSEFGHRALGHRSILMSPSLPGAKYRLNRLKERDPYMPFAPSVLDGLADKWFDRGSGNPFMTSARRALENEITLAGECVHLDGTSRVHSVSEQDNPFCWAVLTGIAELSGIPIVLNTSFNKRGQPIVENVEDALSCFIGLNLDFLATESAIVTRNRRAGLEEVTSVLGSLEIGGESEHMVVVSDLARVLSRHFKASELRIRHLFMLNDEYFSWLIEGRKTTTIRFQRDGVDVPGRCCVPIYRTFGVHPGSIALYGGLAIIHGVRVLKYSELTHDDALRDGFESLEDLRLALRVIYGEVDSSAFVTVYSIQVVAVGAMLELGSVLER